MKLDTNKISDQHDVNKVTQPNEPDLISIFQINTKIPSPILLLRTCKRERASFDSNKTEGPVFQFPK